MVMMIPSGGGFTLDKNTQSEESLGMADEAPTFSEFGLLDRTEILDAPQFTSEDVCRIVSITPKQLENAIDPARAVVRVSPQSRERRQGRRRMFTGGDVLKVAAVFAANAVGFPMRYTATMADEVERRASARLVGLDLAPGLVWLTWPFADGSDWNRAAVYQGKPEALKTPVAVIAIEVDRLIDETLGKLKALIGDEPLPDFTVPDHTPEPDQSPPKNDFFMRWAKDASGRDVLIGLTFEETQEYKTCPTDRRAGDRVRWLELQERHERARQERLAKTRSERMQAAAKEKAEPPQ